MIDRLFLAHPRSVNESYGEHFAVAGRFGVTMLLAGLAALVHAVVPALFVRTGSTAIKRLYGDMTQRQPRLAHQPPAHAGQDWQIEYEI